LLQLGTTGRVLDRWFNDGQWGTQQINAAVIRAGYPGQKQTCCAAISDVGFTAKARLAL
jgi:hypothetical protein